MLNEESCFTLSFKNKHDLRLSNVSFLDIYIVSSDIDKKETRKSSSTLTRSKKSPASTASSSRASSSSSSSTTPALTAPSKCDCILEVLADGIYLVKYKLAKPGIYSLNILVNKHHIGESPYRLVCLDRISALATARVNSASMTNHRKASSTLNVRSFQYNSARVLPNSNNNNARSVRL